MAATDAVEVHRIGERRALSPISILRHSSKLSGANILTVALSFPTSILMARILGPTNIGIVGYLALWSFYAGLARLGLYSAATREMPSLIGREMESEARRVQNVSLSFEFAFLLLPTAVILGAILFEPDPLLRVGLAVTAATFFVASVRDFVGGVNWAYQRYGIIARVTLLIAILSPVFMLGTVSRLGVFSMILAPLVVAMASLGAYLIFAPSIRFRWSWDWAEARRLFKIGFPMALLGFFYWAFRSVGRTVIATGRGFEELGYFVFAMNFVNLAIQIFSDFGNVVQPTLWTEMGRTGNVRKLAHDVVDNVIAIMLVACLAVSLGQAAYGPFVSIFLPKFAGSVPLFDVLILTVPLVAASIIPSILLNSAELNRQGMNAGIWAGALVVNAGLSFVAFRYLDWGTLGVAWVAVVMQAATTAVLYGVTHRYVFDSLRNELPLYGAVVGMFAVDLVLLAAMPLSGPFASHGGALIAGAVRIVLVLVAWVPVAAAVWWARAMRRRVTI